MSSLRERYLVTGVDLFHICNRNDTRVAQALAGEITAQGIVSIDEDRIQDAYSRALNDLPARYAQRGNIVLREPVRARII